MYDQVMLIETRKDMESATFVTVLVGLVMGVVMVKTPPPSPKHSFFVCYCFGVTYCMQLNHAI